MKQRINDWCRSLAPGRAYSILVNVLAVATATEPVDRY